MLFVIDAGNTNIVAALFAAGHIGPDRAVPLHVWRHETRRDEQAAVLINWLAGGLGQVGIEPASVTGAIVSSVVPTLDSVLKTVCENLFGLTPPLVTYDLPGLDLVIDLPHPEQLGADRIVNAVAVKKDYTCPAIVIDCGTATTFDILDARGHFTGGIIAPGPNLSMKALHLAAAKLPDVPVVKPAAVIGTDTVSAMQSGVYWGYVGLIEGLVRGIQSELGAKPIVIATGGLAGLFAEGTKIIDKIDPELTLRGLYYLYEANSKVA